MNETIVFLSEYINPVIGRIQVLVGGVFGLYLIFIVYKIWDMRRQNKIIKEIKSDINSIKRRLMIQDINRTHDKNKENEIKRNKKDIK